MSEMLPINPNVLEWARNTIGLTIQEVALRLKKSEDTIMEWESGKSTPTYAQLEKLAYQIYKRPVAIFFFPNVPEEETPKTAFRTLPDIIIERLPSEIIKLYRKVKVFQLNLEELFDGVKPVNPNLIDHFSLNSRSDISSLALNIRREIDCSVEEQFSWKSPDLAFKNWRKALEKKGIFVFKDAFRNDDYSGFCVYDDRYPIILVNNSMPATRQIFTLFHELGHLLYHLGGVDFRDNYQAEYYEKKYSIYEVNCNKFANEFLVPSKLFNSLELNVSENRIREIANQFSVSREVILRKYLDIGKINDSYYKKMIDKWVEDFKRLEMISEKGGGNYYYNQKSYLAEIYTNLAFSKYYQNKISIENLSEYLNIKVKNISNFEHFAFN